MDLEIYKAVEADDPAALRRLLKSGANVDEFYHDYTLISAKSILHMSCEKGRIDCVKVLLEIGANLSIRDTWLQTPLMYCVLTQYHEIAELILAHDPHIIDIGDKYGKTALHIAVLLEMGANLNIRDTWLQTPLMYCVLTQYHEIAELILAHDPHIIDIGDKYGKTALHIAVLLEMGANLNIRDTWLQTPLMYCVLTQYHEIAELILAHDPHIIDIGDKYGKTALHIAVEYGAIDCIKVLLRYDAYIDVVNNFGVTPLMVACDAKRKDLSADVVLEMAKLLIEYGADVSMKDYRCRRTPLQMAMTRKHVELAELLIAQGADPNVIDTSGRCPITNLLWYHHGLDSAGDVDDDVMIIIVMLMQAGADLNLKKLEQTNPLIMATLYRLTNLVTYFLANGADQNQQFYCNVTPLMLATRNRDVKTLKVLLKHRSDLYREGRVVRGELDYNTDVLKMALDIGAFEAAMVIADAGYDMSRVDYLADWTKTPTESLRRDPGMLDYFRRQAVVVHTLYRLSVLTIRKQLTGCLPEKAAKLPLPKLLIREVGMGDDLT